MKWFSTDDPDERQKQYADYLKKEYGIVLSPKSELLNGAWTSSTITVTEFDLGPAPEPSSSGTGDGCDINDLDIYNNIKTNLEAQKNKPVPITISMSFDKNGSESLIVTSEDGEDVKIPATYQDGTLNASLNDEGLIITFLGEVYGSGSLTLQGTFTIELPSKNGKSWIKGDW